MADSVTYEEFQKEENKKSNKYHDSPCDTEATTIEELENTISDLQKTIQSLTIKAKEDRINQKWETQQVKESLRKYQKHMDDQMTKYALRIQDLEAKLSTINEPHSDAESSIWEINTASSDSDVKDQ